MTKKTIDKLTYSIIGAGIEVHKHLGPGLLESVYHKCMKHEMRKRGLNFDAELSVPIRYKDVALESELRCDFVVEGWIVVELKATEKIIPIHQAQLLTYMRLLEMPKGLLLNFNCVNLFKEGQKTMVNRLYHELQE